MEKLRSRVDIGKQGNYQPALVVTPNGESITRKLVTKKQKF
jgi:hypothetical protein